MKQTVNTLRKMKEEGKKVVYITGYDYMTAKYEERAGVDMILVGDSLGNVMLGYDSTFPVTMDDMIMHAKSVRRGAPNTFIVGDMPFMSYQPSDRDAILNAGRFIKEAGSDCVKLEGATDACLDRIKAITQAGMLVMGHIGLTPQFGAQLGGNKAQGKNFDAVKALVEAAKKIEAAGAFSILVEAVPAIVGKAITKAVSIPVYGIGAGSFTDGQLLIFADAMGYYDDFTPKFIKKYANIGEIMLKGFTDYANEVRDGVFPNNEIHSYKIDEEESKMIEDELL